MTPEAHPPPNDHILLWTLLTVGGILGVMVGAPIISAAITYQVTTIPSSAPSNTWQSDGTTYYNYTISWHSQTTNLVVKCDYYALGHPFTVAYNNALWLGSGIWLTRAPAGCYI